MNKRRMLTIILLVLGIGLSFFQSNTTVHAENELPGIVITSGKHVSKLDF